ncbi:tRNA (guanine-N(7)-)-methyltransferase non-catalytic subunit wdr4 isoform X2 [Chiloscyllium punctatum]
MALGLCGSLVVLGSGGSRIAGFSLGESGEPFIFDCPKETPSQAGPSDEERNGVVAFAFSPSGTYVAVSMDNKQLLLFRTRPWECLSVRTALRRSTSLAITGAEDRILLADKSGDVYSFSISHPNSPGQLQLGHLSMLLAVAVSPDDRYIITADRDEKIRVSSLEHPYIIEAYCLGHHEFVSQLSIPPNHPQLLVSGSGDGTIRLWEYEKGSELHCLDLSELQPSRCEKNRCAVMRLAYCRGRDLFAVLCDSPSSVYVLELDVEAERLLHQQTIMVKQRAWDVTFDDCGGLWLLDGDRAVLYQQHEGRWQEIPDHPDQTKINEVIHSNWPVFEGLPSVISCRNLYKMNIDNMAEYRMKKEQRIDQRQKKRTSEFAAESRDSKRPRMGAVKM